MSDSTNLFSRKRLLHAGGALGLLAAIPRVTSAADAPMIGAWHLQSFDAEQPDGTWRPRYGDRPVGYLIYTADGHVSAILSAMHRPKFESPDAATSTTEQRTRALNEFLAYAGSYHVRGNHVFHKVETSVFTDLVGRTLEREFHIKGDVLTIRTLPPYLWKNASTLVWKKA